MQLQSLLGRKHLYQDVEKVDDQEMALYKGVTFHLACVRCQEGAIAREMYFNHRGYTDLKPRVRRLVEKEVGSIGLLAELSVNG